MRTYVITGGTTGIGSAVREQLREQGHEVLNIDYKDGDILADLSTPEGLSLIHISAPAISLRGQGRTPARCYSSGSRIHITVPFPQAL